MNAPYVWALQLETKYCSLTESFLGVSSGENTLFSKDNFHRNQEVVKKIIGCKNHALEVPWACLHLHASHNLI